MAENGRKWLNRLKYVEMAGIGWKWMEMDGITGNGWNGRKGWKWLEWVEMAVNGCKWL